MFPLTRPNGSPTLLPAQRPTLCAALARSTSWPGQPTPSMSCGGKRGMTPARLPAPPRGARCVVGALPTIRTSGSRSRQELQRRPVRVVEEPENLTYNQRVKLAWIASTDPKLYRGYLLKEGLRTVFQLPLVQATEALDRWIGWARRCRTPASSPSKEPATGYATAAPCPASEHNTRQTKKHTKLNRPGVSGDFLV